MSSSPETGPETGPTRMAGRSSLAAATSLAAVSMTVMNVLGYAFVLASTRLLGPERFGGVSSLLGILLIANVGALALQATAARRIATSPAGLRDEVAHDVIVSSWQTALGLTVLFLIATPALMATLHTPLVASLMVGLTVAPLTMTGGYLGVLQGAGHWRWVALTFLATGIGRCLFGVLALAVDRSVTAAMVGVATGAAMAAFVAWWACRHIPHRAVGRHRGLLREVWHNSHSLLAFFVLTNLDVLIARNQFTSLESGVYAAGSIIAKTCLFLPEFVIIVAFPRMAQHHAADAHDRTWLKPLGVVAGIGACVVLGTVLGHSLAVTFVGGSAYTELGAYAWLFAVEGTCYALMQMIVYRQIARQAHVAVYLWPAAAAFAAIGLVVAETNQHLVSAMIGLVILAAVPMMLSRSPRRA